MASASARPIFALADVVGRLADDVAEQRLDDRVIRRELDAAGPAPGKVTRATRSLRLRVADEPPRRVDGRLARPAPMLPESIAIITSRPACAPALEVYSRAWAARPAIARSTAMNCADAMRRGLPSTASVKSSGRQVRHGPAVLVDHVDVDRDEIDSRLERGPWRLLLLRRRVSATTRSAAANPFMGRVYCGLLRDIR